MYVCSVPRDLDPDDFHEVKEVREKLEYSQGSSQEFWKGDAEGWLAHWV